MKCKIIRKNNIVDYVEAPNGERSILYDDLVKYSLDREASLDYLALTYTEDFKKTTSEKTPKDKNGEVGYKTVLRYHRRLKHKDQKATKRDLFNLYTNLASLNFESSDELIQKVKQIVLPEGFLDLKAFKAYNNKVYTELEADYLTTGYADSKVDEFIAKIDNSKVTIYPSNSDVLLETDDIVGVGKIGLKYSSQLQESLYENLHNVNSDYEFGNVILGKFPNTNIADKYFTDENFAEQFRNKYRNAKKIPVFRISNDSLVRSDKNNDLELMYETLLTDGNLDSIISDIFLFSRLTEDVIEGSEKSVEDLLDRIEKRAVTFNIDVIGLKEKFSEKTLQETQDFLDELTNFISLLATNSVNLKDVENFSNTKSQYFETSPKFINEFKHDEYFKNRTVLKLNSNKSDIDLFDQYDLIRLKDNYFQKVNRSVSLDQSLNIIVSSVRDGDLLLPKEAYYPSLFNSKEFKIEKVNNTPDDDIKRDILRYLDKNYKGDTPKNTELAREYTLSAKLLRINTQPIDNMNEFDYKFRDFKGDFDYLTSDFIADFQKEILKSKALNSELYNEVYRYFSIDSSGIYLNDTNDFLIGQIKILMPDNRIFKNLKQYSNIHRFSNVDLLFDLEESNSFRRMIFLKNYYANNINTLPEYQGGYSVFENKLRTNFTTEPFIKVQNNLYELMALEGNDAVYEVVTINNDPNYYNFGYELKVPTRVNSSLSAENPKIKMRHLYTTKEGKNIDKKLCDG